MDEVEMLDSKNTNVKTNTQNNIEVETTLPMWSSGESLRAYVPLLHTIGDADKLKGVLDSVKNQDITELMKILKLDEFENVIVWDPHKLFEFYPADINKVIAEKIVENEEDYQFKFQWCVLHITLSYEFYVVKDTNKSLEMLNEVQKHIEELKANNCKEQLFLKVSRALEHVVFSSMIILLKESNLFDAIKIHQQKLPSLSGLNNVESAALYGVKASVFGEYGLCGHQLGLKYSNDAIQLDPENAHWHFLKGKFIGRIRRVEDPFGVPSQEELNAFETAIEMSMDASYLAFAASVYQDMARCAFKRAANKGVSYTVVDDVRMLNKKSVMYYRKAVLLAPSSSSIKFRVARGFMKYSGPYKDADYAKTLLTEGLIIAPNDGYGLHGMGLFQYRFAKDNRLAREYFTKCMKMNIFGAYIDLLKIDFEEDRSIDVAHRLNEIYERFESVDRRCQVLSQKMSYYLFIRHDIKKAWKCLCDILELDKQYKDIYTHRSILFYVKSFISLPEVMVDELKIKLSQQLSSSERALYENMLNTIDLSNIPNGNLLVHSEVLYLRQTILDEADGRYNRNKKDGRLKYAPCSMQTNRRWKPKKAQIESSGCENKMDELSNIRRSLDDWANKVLHCSADQGFILKNDGNPDHSESQNDDRSVPLSLNSLNLFGDCQVQNSETGAEKSKIEYETGTQNIDSYNVGEKDDEIPLHEVGNQKNEVEVETNKAGNDSVTQKSKSRNYASLFINSSDSDDDSENEVCKSSTINHLVEQDGNSVIKKDDIHSGKQHIPLNVKSVSSAFKRLSMSNLYDDCHVLNTDIDTEYAKTKLQKTVHIGQDNVNQNELVYNMANESDTTPLQKDENLNDSGNKRTYESIFVDSSESDSDSKKEACESSIRNLANSMFNKCGVNHNEIQNIPVNVKVVSSSLKRLSISDLSSEESCHAAKLMKYEGN